MPPRPGDAVFDEEEINQNLQNQMLALSIQERTQIQEEVHGVTSLAVEETPELIEQSLAEFQRHIDATEPNPPYVVKKTYQAMLDKREQERERNERIRREREQKQQKQPTSNTASSPSSLLPSEDEEQTTHVYGRHHYALEDENFRLRFLRVDLFDVPAAATRFLRYLNATRSLWGDCVLERPVTVRDLQRRRNERSDFRKGIYQLLPFRDRAGRKIVCGVGDAHTSNFKSPSAQVRIWFYICDAATRHCVETQRTGLVSVTETHLWKSMKFDVAFMRDSQEMLAAVPTRVVALHLCLPETMMSRVLTRTVQTMCALAATPLRVHTWVGTTQECRYRMKAYGIPTEMLPITDTGNVKMERYTQWIKVRQHLEDRDEERRQRFMRQAREDERNNITLPIHSRSDSPAISVSEDNLVLVECPCRNDICFRQGTSSMENPGNELFRHWILRHFDEKEQRKREGIEERSSPVSSLLIHPAWAATGLSTSSSKTGKLTYGDKEDQRFCDWLLHKVQVETNGRFLEWDRKLFVWVQMKTSNAEDLTKIRNKIMIAMYNCQKKVRIHATTTSHATAATTTTSSGNSSSNESDSDGHNYRFIDGGSSRSSPDSCLADCREGSKTRKRRKNK